MNAARKTAQLPTTLLDFQMTALKASSLPTQMHLLVAAAQDETLPLGVRIYAATVLGFGVAGNPTEVVFGPSEQRVAALDQLATEPVLALATIRAREPFSMSIRERHNLIGGVFY